MRLKEGLCVSGAWYIICQDLVNCYFYFVYSLLDLGSSECDVVSLYVVCCSVNISVCFVCCVFDSVCELFGETISNVFECSCYFVVECYGSV